MKKGGRFECSPCNFNYITIWMSLSQKNRKKGLEGINTQKEEVWKNWITLTKAIRRHELTLNPTTN